MVNDKSYSARLVVSKKVKYYHNNQCVDRFIEENPEYEGKKPTENQIETWLIKSKLGLFKLENGKSDLI